MSHSYEVADPAVSNFAVSVDRIKDARWIVAVTGE
jgi:hypothetical protein